MNNLTLLISSKIKRTTIYNIVLKLAVPIIILLTFLFPEYYLNRHTSVFIEDHWHFHFYALLSTLCLPIIFLSLNRWIGSFFLTLYTGFLFFFIKVAIKIGKISDDNITAIMGTNWAEIISTLGDNIPISLFLLCFLAIVFAIAIKICHFRPLILGFSLSCVIIPWFYHWHSTVISWTRPDSDNDSVTNTAEGRTNIFFETYPGVPGLLIYGGYELLFYKDIPSTPHTQQDEMILSLGKEKAKNIIIILGESATALRHGYLNPALKTTPFVSNLITKKMACSIKNAHAVAPLTNLALPRILSFQSVDHPEKLYNRKNIIELASQAAYKTYWIGNQTGKGPYSSRYGYISRYADFTLRPDFLKFPPKSGSIKEEIINFHKKNTIKISDDFNLLVPLKAILEKDPSEHKFIILHLWGSHAGYSDKSDENDRFALPNSSAYDRSIHHTDRFIEQVTQLANKAFNQKYLLFYTSDHGEDVSRQTHGIWNGDISQYQIPMFFTWGSYEAQNGQKYCQIASKMRSPNTRFSQIMDKILLSEMMGYKMNPNIVKLVSLNDRVIHVDGHIYIYPNVRTSLSSGEAVSHNLSLP